MEGMMSIIEKLAQSDDYRHLESLIYTFKGKNFPPSIARRIKMAFLIVKRKIRHEMRILSKSGASNTTKVYFYTLVRKFLPAFPRFYKLNI